MLLVTVKADQSKDAMTELTNCWTVIVHCLDRGCRDVAKEARAVLSHKIENRRCKGVVTA